MKAVSHIAFPRRRRKNRRRWRSGDRGPTGFLFHRHNGEIRVYSRELGTNELSGHVAFGAQAYGILDDDHDGMPTWWS